MSNLPKERQGTEDIRNNRVEQRWAGRKVSTTRKAKIRRKVGSELDCAPLRVINFLIRNCYHFCMLGGRDYLRSGGSYY